MKQEAASHQTQLNLLQLSGGGISVKFVVKTPFSDARYLCNQPVVVSYCGQTKQVLQQNLFFGKDSNMWLILLARQLIGGVAASYS